MRQNFPKSVMVACIKRATINDVAYCQNCGAMAKRFQIDHDNPDGLTGKPTIENARLLCIPCHKEKTKDDVAKIAKAKRNEARDLGVKKSGPPIQSRGFAPGKPKREKLPMPERRMMFR